MSCRECERCEKHGLCGSTSARRRNGASLSTIQEGVAASCLAFSAPITASLKHVDLAFEVGQDGRGREAVIVLLDNRHTSPPRARVGHLGVRPERFRHAVPKDRDMPLAEGVVVDCWTCLALRLSGFWVWWLGFVTIWSRLYVFYNQE